MKYFLLILSFVSVGSSFAGRNKIKKKTSRNSLALEKIIHKKLAERVTQKGRLLELVDANVAHVGLDHPATATYEKKSHIDWGKLAERVTAPGALAPYVDPEIALIGIITPSQPPKS